MAPHHLLDVTAEEPHLDRPRCDVPAAHAIPSTHHPWNAAHTTTEGTRTTMAMLVSVKNTYYTIIIYYQVPFVFLNRRSDLTASSYAASNALPGRAARKAIRSTSVSLIRNPCPANQSDSSRRRR